MNALVFKITQFPACFLDFSLHQNTQQWAIRRVGGYIRPRDIRALCNIGNHNHIGTTIAVVLLLSEMQMHFAGSLKSLSQMLYEIFQI